MLQDLRFSVRSLLHAPGFALAAILTLGLGIGATTIVYSIVEGMILRPLPFGDRSERLATVHSIHPTQTSMQHIDDAGVSYADAMDMRRAAAFEALELFATRNVSLASDRDSERVSAASVTPGLFRLLGVSPALGRDFEEADGAAIGLEQVAIIGDGLWRRLYGARQDIIGQPVLLNGRALTVIGVMPPRFDFPERQQVWFPLRQEPGVQRDRRGAFLGVGLLREGVSRRQATDELNAIAAVLAAEYPDTNRNWSAHVAPMRDLFVSTNTQRSVSTMFVAVALVLLTACANIAGLLVARGVGRQRELAVRASLGASRRDLVRLLFAESTVVAAAGGAVGLLMASWGLRALLASIYEPPPAWTTPAINAQVLAFVALASGACAVLAGLLPALRVSRVRGVGALGSGTRSVGPTADQRRFQGLLVGAQVALSLVLVAGAVLLSLSVMRLQRADAGFDPGPLASLRFYIAGDAYDDPTERARAIERVAEALTALPSVSATAVTGSIPADDGGETVIVDMGAGVRDEDGLAVSIIPVNPAFWEALGLALEGRTFTAGEATDIASDAVVVGRRLAERLWPDGDAIGRVFHVNDRSGRHAYRVVGVSPDLVYEELGEETEQSRLVFYVTHAQRPYRTLAALLRVDGDPGVVLQPARAAIRSVDPAFAAFDTLTMTQRRDATMWGERFMGTTFALFALMGLLLASLGAYGLTAYAAAQRSREIGVRVAVGATRAHILRLLLSRGVRLAMIGVIVGLPFAALAARGLSGQLFEMSPWTPGVWVTVPVVIFAAVLLASFIPALRASGADPARALSAD